MWPVATFERLRAQQQQHVEPPQKQPQNPMSPPTDDVVPSPEVKDAPIPPTVAGGGSGSGGGGGGGAAATAAAANSGSAHLLLPLQPARFPTLPDQSETSANEALPEAAAVPETSGSRLSAAAAMWLRDQYPNVSPTGRNGEYTRGDLQQVYMQSSAIRRRELIELNARDMAQREGVPYAVALCFHVS
jgi:hypothetical protein